MKIRNGKIEYCEFENRAEQEMREKLSSKLNSWLDLNLLDFPEILKNMGVRSKNYDIVSVREKKIYGFVWISLKIKTLKSNYTVNIFKEHNVIFQIILNKGTGKMYYVRKNMQIEQIVM